MVTYFYFATYNGPGACPKGMQPLQSSETFLKTLPPEERTRLLRQENARELSRKMSMARSPDGTVDVCKAPWAAPAPALYTLQGDRNDGLDLDGSKDDNHSDAYTCPHKQYVGQDGQPGVDNALGQIYACISGMHEGGTLSPYFTTQMRAGMWSMLIEVSGVTDVRNDPDVTVDFYAGDDTMVKDPGGKVLAGASLAPKTDPKFHRQVKASIKDGVLETSALNDLLIPDIMLSNRLPPWTIQRPKLKLTLNPDGTAKGFLGGYLPDTMYNKGGGDALGEGFTGMPCDFMYHAVVKLADGAKDPKTGKCHSLSAAFRIEAIPAFIVHPDQAPVRTFAQAK